MVKIGNIELDVPFFQAPLSGYTDRAMRVLAREFGAPLAYTGVLLDKIATNAKAVRKLQFRPGDDEHPVGAQILGADPKTMALAAKSFESVGFDAIDLNFACPAPKVLRRGRGGAMLKDPATVIETYNRVRDAVKCPVTMKLRIGFGSEDGTRENFWQICEEASAGGVDALVIHGRTVIGRYRGQADWDILAEVKRKFSDTVIFGSGDIFDAETMVERINSTGIDGVIVARGAIGNPWIFREARALFEGKPKPAPPTLKEQGEVMIRHFNGVADVKLNIKGVRYFRKFAAKYCKGHPQRKKALLAIMAAKDGDAIRSAITEWFLR